MTTPTTPDQLDGAALLSAAIALSGLSARQFARDVLVRDPRTLFRWLAGAPIPEAVRVKCRALLAEPPPARFASSVGDDDRYRVARRCSICGVALAVDEWRPHYELAHPTASMPPFKSI